MTVTVQDAVAERAQPKTAATDTRRVAHLYLDVLARSLLNWYYGDTVIEYMKPISLRRRLMEKFLARYGLKACQPSPVPFDQLTDGHGMHTGGFSLVGLKRMRNVQHCIERVIDDGIPGDLLEAGVWRGGTCIFMRGALEAYGVKDRKVWVADSFQGLPEPNPEKYPADADEWMHRAKQLAIPCDAVKENFERFGLLDDQVDFIEGFFSETLMRAPIKQLAVLRLDGDMYESTMDTLLALYPKLSPGGYLIVDDYQRDNCKKAVFDDRQAQGIDDPIEEIDWMGAYWRKDGDRFENAKD